MKRRKFISGAATTAILGIAGCSGTGETNTETAETTDTDQSTPTGTEDTPTPTEVVKANWDAYRNVRKEEYIATFHSDSPERTAKDWLNDDYWPEESSSFTIEEREVVQKGEDIAFIEEIVRGEYNGNVSRWKSTIELRTENGTWKIWGIRDEALIEEETQ